MMMMNDDDDDEEPKEGVLPTACSLNSAWQTASHSTAGGCGVFPYLDGTRSANIFETCK